MSLPDVVSREQWLEARKRLLAQEKELTRRHDELNASRRRLSIRAEPVRRACDGSQNP